MTTVVEQPTTSAPAENDQLHNRNRALKITIVVLAVIALALGGVLIYNATTTEDSGSELPAEVQQLLDDFTAAMENSDYAAMQELVTDDFRRPEYGIHSDGTNEYRATRDLEDFDFLEREGVAEYSISTTDPPLVRGDGPWIVSVAQDWEQANGGGTGYETIYTFAIVDRDGVLQIEDAYWAGIGPVLFD